jgi:hypothetical protein
MVMLPSPILPLAEHAKFGQNWFDVSIGSKFVCINYSMPMDACFFKSGGLFHQLVWLYLKIYDTQSQHIRKKGSSLLKK